MPPQSAESHDSLNGGLENRRGGGRLVGEMGGGRPVVIRVHPRGGREVAPTKKSLTRLAQVAMISCSFTDGGGTCRPRACTARAQTGGRRKAIAARHVRVSSLGRPWAQAAHCRRLYGMLRRPEDTASSNLRSLRSKPRSSWESPGEGGPVESRPGDGQSR